MISIGREEIDDIHLDNPTASNDLHAIVVHDAAKKIIFRKIHHFVGLFFRIHLGIVQNGARGAR